MEGIVNALGLSIRDTVPPPLFCVCVAFNMPLPTAVTSLSYSFPFIRLNPRSFKVDLFIWTRSSIAEHAL